MKLSQRIENITPSATLSLGAKAKAMKRAGLDVINLSVGEPDFQTPKHIKEAAVRAIMAGQSDFYTPANGILELRTAIAEFMSKAYDTPIAVDNVAVTSGGKYALYAITQAIIDEGDEVLIPLPYWVSYGEQVKLAGGNPLFVKPASSALKVTVADLEKARTPKTKMLIINSPQNPSGLIYSQEELEKIGEWAVKHDIILLSDDMYGMLVYNENQFVSPFELSEAIKKQTIIVSGFSKTYAMTGWRVGFILADEHLIKRITAFLSHSTSNLAAVSQYAALAALQGPQAQLAEMRLAYQERLAVVFEKLQQIPGFKLDQKPQGAFYLFPNVKEAVEMTGFASTADFIAALLEEQHVAVVPGAAFGMEDHLRLSYAADLDSLNEALNRIQTFMAQHAVR